MTPVEIQLYNSSGCTSTGGKVPGEQRKRVPEQLVPHPLLCILYRTQQQQQLVPRIAATIPFPTVLYMATSSFLAIQDRNHLYCIHNGTNWQNRSWCKKQYNYISTLLHLIPTTALQSWGYSYYSVPDCKVSFAIYFMELQYTKFWIQFDFQHHLVEHTGQRCHTSAHYARIGTPLRIWGEGFYPDNVFAVSDATHLYATHQSNGSQCLKSWFGFSM